MCRRRFIATVFIATVMLSQGTEIAALSHWHGQGFIGSERLLIGAQCKRILKYMGVFGFVSLTHISLLNVHFNYLIIDISHSHS